MQLRRVTNHQAKVKGAVEASLILTRERLAPGKEPNF